MEPTRAELEQRAAEYAATRNPELRHQVVVGHQFLVRACARRMRRRREPLEDLVSVCNVGLLEALERYNPQCGEFRPYAVRTIWGELRHYYRSCWRVHVPRRTQELALRLPSLVDALTSELCRAPTGAEIAQRAGVSQEAVTEAQGTDSAYYPGPIGRHERPQQGGEEGSVIRLDIERLLGQLSERQRRALELVYLEGRGLPATAQALGVSTATATRILRSALDRLRYLARR